MQPAPMDTNELTRAAEQLAEYLRELGGQKGMVAAELEEIDREHADILHRIEHPRCLYRERGRLTTRLKRIRRRRRALKDWCKLNQPLLEYLGDDSGKRLQNMVDNLVGIGRRVEKRGEEVRRAAEVEREKGR